MSRSQDQTNNLSLLAGGHLPDPTEGPSSRLLEVFPNAYPLRSYLICIDFPEFTSLCPVTGQPDFGRIHVAYIPDKLCVESKSFKLYMFAFRRHQSFMETITNTVLDDLCLVMDPCWLRVEGLFVPRGGTRISVFAEHIKDESSERMQKVARIAAEYRTDCHAAKYAYGC
ncbi:MAG: NADPH-dependent 7-cyano-7-deazaguanine reductase QueF [Desulfovibrio sp.]|nr:NADPH-dependent 7-cyano-7-deazaguanine reductase QueF [Desulfovibrio sp.]